MQRPLDADGLVLHAISELVADVTGLLFIGVRTHVPASSVDPLQNSWKVEWATTDEAARSTERREEASFIGGGVGNVD